MNLRVWDSAEKEYVKEEIYVDDSGGLCLMHGGDKIPIHSQCSIELNTGFVDSEGKEIFQNDIIHVAHTGQDSACMKPEGYDYHIDWSSDKGQWMAYSYNLGYKMLFAPLFMLAHKGIVTGRYNEI